VPAALTRKRLQWVGWTSFAVFLTLALLVVLDGRQLSRLDATIERNVRGWVLDHPAVARAAELVTWLGNPLVVTAVVAVVGVLLLVRDRRRLAVYLVVTAAGGGLLNTAVKLLVERSRPSAVDHLVAAHGFSFPSGHAAASVYAYGTLAVVCLLAVPGPVGRPLATACLALVPLIGASRVLLGVHWTSDVVAGWSLALSWLCLTTSVLLRVEQPQRGPDLQVQPGDQRLG
jgi:undecaprenyl-diphosphatase